MTRRKTGSQGKVRISRRKRKRKTRKVMGLNSHRRLLLTYKRGEKERKCVKRMAGSVTAKERINIVTAGYFITTNPNKPAKITQPAKPIE